jgi:hypothetical protein
MILNNKTFALFAARCYDNPNCEGVEEFNEDLQRFKYLKRLFTKYLATGEIKERLVLNHIVVLYNLFGVECTRMLFLKMDGQWSVLKPFLLELGYLPERIYDVGKHHIIDTAMITMDQEIIEKLRNI